MPQNVDIFNSYFDKGYMCFHDFIDLQENPYPEHSNEAYLWEAGWLRAMADLDAELDFAHEDEIHPSGVA